MNYQHTKVSEARQFLVLPNLNFCHKVSGELKIICHAQLWICENWSYDVLYRRILEIE